MVHISQASLISIWWPNLLSTSYLLDILVWWFRNWCMVKSTCIFLKNPIMRTMIALTTCDVVKTITRGEVREIFLLEFLRGDNKNITTSDWLRNVYHAVKIRWLVKIMYGNSRWQRMFNSWETWNSELEKCYLQKHRVTTHPVNVYGMPLAAIITMK